MKDQKWARTPIDRFLLAKIEEAGLTPNPEADRRALIRRVSLDLTGLPPDPDDVAAFVADTSPDAYAKVVARLLASPHYGEHRARYWLDAARYGDTNGLHYDNYRGGIWPYRDWVVRAFNGNMPFDRFAVEQLAGDLLPNPTLDQLIATGFVRSNTTTNENGVIEEEVRFQYIKRPRRHDRHRVPRADRRVCHLPRPQVRSDYAEGPLRARGVLQQHDRARDGQQPAGPAAGRDRTGRSRPCPMAGARSVSENRCRSRMKALHAAPNARFDAWLASRERAEV